MCRRLGGNKKRQISAAKSGVFFAAKSGVRFSLKGKHGSVGLSDIKADAVVIVREATGGVFRLAERARPRKNEF